MYSLKVLGSFSHPDGREFAAGHDCHELSLFEVSELLLDYPDCFEAGDEATAEIVKDKEKIQHYGEAIKRQREEFETIMAKKVKK